MKTEDLQKQGLTQEQIDFVMAENGKDLKKLQKANDDLTVDRDTWKEKAETAEETLKNFEGIDPENIKEELASYKKKAEDAEKEYQAKLADRDFNDTLKEVIAKAGGKNEKAIHANLDIETLKKSKNQREDVEKAVEALKSSEETSFMFDLESDNSKARFTGPKKKPDSNPNGLTKKDIMAIKDPIERQAKIAENMDLFEN